MHRQRGGDLHLGRRGRWALRPVRGASFRPRRARTYVIGLSGKAAVQAAGTLPAPGHRRGAGCGSSTPHALLVDDLMRLLLTRGVLDDPAIRERIVYVDPARKDYVVPFNVLATGGDPYDIAASVLEAFRRTWPEPARSAAPLQRRHRRPIALIENRLTLVHMPAPLDG
ncbi:MAG: hypothetical protein M5R40_17045 [Anaerolineae bacterium]|nr:hypothetical protein [Anaerolineae bacterium]